MPHRQLIRDLRESCGMSLRELSAKADMHPSQLSDVELGKRDLRVGQLRKICRALGVSLGEFFGEDASSTMPIKSGDLVLARRPDKKPEAFTAHVTASGATYLLPDAEGAPVELSALEVISVTRG